jgi:hypothetical protein
MLGRCVTIQSHEESVHESKLSYRISDGRAVEMQQEPNRSAPLGCCQLEHDLQALFRES